eukprot:TRINITY_DN10790_c0_g1_i1.p1 TRINITY_DN10790_c0_g1~~TRINITY_DN10790_c0_g1_i1.p1  ORF type:complete len:301 (+),score=73.44 TRINITY_DN10790_c0_g1_i1:213-1115(+)
MTSTIIQPKPPERFHRENQRRKWRVAMKIMVRKKKKTNSSTKGPSKSGRKSKNDDDSSSEEDVELGEDSDGDYEESRNSKNRQNNPGRIAKQEVKSSKSLDLEVPPLPQEKVKKSSTDSRQVSFDELSNEEEDDKKREDESKSESNDVDAGDGEDSYKDDSGEENDDSEESTAKKEVPKENKQTKKSAMPEPKESAISTLPAQTSVPSTKSTSSSIESKISASEVLETHSKIKKTPIVGTTKKRTQDESLGTPVQSPLKRPCVKMTGKQASGGIPMVSSGPKRRVVGLSRNTRVPPLHPK